MEIIGAVILYFFTVVGGSGTLYAFLKWSANWLRGRTSPPKRAISAINIINAGFERTVFVPYIVRETVKVVEQKVVPVFVPNVPSRHPDRPSPDWLVPEPRVPGIRPGRPPIEIRPGRPLKMPWTRPQRETRIPEYSRRPMGDGFTRPGNPGREFGDLGDRMGGRPQGGEHPLSGGIRGGFDGSRRFRGSEE